MRTIEEGIKELEKYTNIHNCLPEYKSSLGRWMHNHLNIPKVKEIYNEFKIRRTKEEGIKELEEYTNIHKCLPEYKSSLYFWMSRHLNIPEVREIYNRFSIRGKTYKEREFKELVEYMKVNGFPKRRSSLYNWICNNKESYKPLQQFLVLYEHKDNPKAQYLLNVFMEKLDF